MVSQRHYATGKRKYAIARAWIEPGPPDITVNGRTFDHYFTLLSQRIQVEAPLEVTNTRGQFRITASVCGGGRVRAGRSPPPRDCQSLGANKPGLSRGPQKGRLADTRSPCERKEKIRTKRRSKPIPIFQALSARTLQDGDEKGKASMPSLFSSYSCMTRQQSSSMRRTRLQVAVLGASGYTGGELLRLLSCHPYVTVTNVTADKSVGLPVTSLFPHLETFHGFRFTPLHVKPILKKVDLVFSALPHTKSMEPVTECVKAKKPVIDLSADFRLMERDTYETMVWHAACVRPALLKKGGYTGFRNFTGHGSGGLDWLPHPAVTRRRLFCSWLHCWPIG